ncbi:MULTISPECIES: 3-hydroxyisobutyrate dehydrogenase [Acinetobacter]|uniref:3-hydroxyisobutyrate dehydrogenase n=1 Tax=Acinetobacter TaxID=469 RepID=UPI000CEBC790|nr:MULTISPECIES: 3-hydroxyisobutyrate dehydrogenase [Acinetobacter]MDM1286814.1 3-hydroxyisobutyrate dehydrogenase [Acinetobacter indicus]MDM1493431.1 3-hydroxyisobutyrate dehydrogenase [Acinetobacter indicus]NOJ67350.1 3-hydroxyisobutyrate dehydrogenase [Acinetobacter indicus]UNW10926.1 3-hydroxyisobutyrate dehydrogenase [Acinetobacter indicus]
MKIAFIGLGNMGGSMAQNLLKAGHQVFGYDLSETALAHFAQAGGVVCQSPQDAAQQANVVVTMLPAAQHVRTVYLGEQGILNVLPAGSLCIDSSTIDPKTIQDVAAAAQARQIQVCDAPVSGGTLGAKEGTLTFMVGGDAATFEAVKPVLSAMGKNLVHCGAIGTGQVAKICNNLILGISMTAVAEGMALGVKLGIDPQALAGVINSSSGRCWSSEVYNPWPDICANAPASRGYTDGFAAQLMLKDLGLAVDAAHQAEHPIVLGSLVQQLYQQLCQEGHAHLDFSSIMHHYTTPTA